MDPKILIVEDHEDSAQGLAVLLRKAGHAVAVASSCQDALSVAAAEKPNLVLCDIGLPDGDGCDLLRELKQQYQIAGIAVSAYGMPSDKQRYIEAGFSEIVIKPYNMQQIETAIVRARLFKPRHDPSVKK